ncbi:hypothetical protein BIW11_10457 [Tropilaelaps mercedesae]|uniref:Uncharacterized protein n=1 Tax=Tropilaelaps mercedesae TaxID=418985 RepID=A0A1V9XFY9_9ACAR|nr:hypothetical protein BIW11_10457 [Tropilaelaps mercedesae]
MAVAVPLLLTAILSFAVRSGFKLSGARFLRTNASRPAERRIAWLKNADAPETEKIPLSSGLDINKHRGVYQMQCHHKTTAVDDGVVEVHSTLSLLNRKILDTQEDADLHFKIEANVSFPIDVITLERSEGRITVAIIHPALLGNLTFIYQYVNCERPEQPVRVWNNPLATKNLSEFRDYLDNHPNVGTRIGSFLCTSTPLDLHPHKEMRVSTFRILIDMNMNKKRLTLHTCSAENWVCLQTYEKTVPMDLSNMDKNETAEIKTVFVLVRHADSKIVEWPPSSFIKTKTWCELKDPE